jgi:hypothetical protein
VGSKVLRDRWQCHIDAALSRPVLIVDEAQEMLPTVLAELRLLSSARLDSHILLTVVLGGDGRLLERLRSEELAPLGSRMRVLCQTAFASCSSQPTVRSSSRPNIFGPSSTNRSPTAALPPSRAWTRRSATAASRSPSSPTSSTTALCSTGGHVSVPGRNQPELV